MRWLGGRESGNIEDQRGIGGGLPIRIGGLGAIAVIVVGLFLGVDPSVLLSILGGEQTVQNQPADGSDYGTS